MKIDKTKLVEKRINDISKFLTLNDLVVKNLISKSWYSCPKREKFQKPLDSKEATCGGYYFGNTLVGITTSFTCTTYDLEEYDLKNLDYKNCIDQGVTAVHPGYFGNGIQNYMTSMFFERHKKEHYEYCIATVHPENEYSLNNLLHQGYKMIRIKDIHYGKRCIMLKKL